MSWQGLERGHPLSSQYPFGQSMDLAAGMSILPMVQRTPASRIGRPVRSHDHQCALMRQMDDTCFASAPSAVAAIDRGMIASTLALAFPAVGRWFAWPPDESEVPKAPDPEHGCWPGSGQLVAAPTYPRRTPSPREHACSPPLSPRAASSVSPHWLLTPSTAYHSPGRELQSTVLERQFRWSGRWSGRLTDLPIASSSGRVVVLGKILPS